MDFSLFGGQCFKIKQIMDFGSRGPWKMYAAGVTSYETWVLENAEI